MKPMFSFSEKQDIEIICPQCGHNISSMRELHGPNGVIRIATCKQCNNTTINETIIENSGIAQQSTTPTVTCPYCSSTDCKKISTASKIGKVAMWGVLAAGSVGHTWHCNSCGSNFG